MNRVVAVSYTHLDVYKRQVYDLTEKPFDGEGKMALTSNKVGNVTVQVVAQVQVTNGETGVTDKDKATQTKYYTCLLYTSRCV